MAQRVISHHTVNGQIESQAYQGFTQAILTDALGSVVKTSSNDPNLRYTPYGSPLGGSTWVQSLFTWVGSFGYRVTNAKYIESYVRARHYSAKSGAWTTVDPLWPEERPYEYGYSSPFFYIDPFGLGPLDPCERRYDRCIAPAASRRRRCVSNAYNIGSKLRRCDRLPRPAREECRQEVLHEANIKNAECLAEFDAANEICTEDYEICKERRRQIQQTEAVVCVGVAAYEFCKWALAIGLAPETGGCSLGLLAIP